MKQVNQNRHFLQAASSIFNVRGLIICIGGHIYVLVDIVISATHFSVKKTTLLAKEEIPNQQQYLLHNQGTGILLSRFTCIFTNHI